MKAFFITIGRGIKFLFHSLTRNFFWKLVALAVAVLLWSYVISSDPSITREIPLTGVDVIISGESVLQGRELALLTDAASALQDVRVRIKVPQSDYARVTADSVSVELDLSRIRQTGTQVVTLTGNSAYGEVVQITPATIALEVEELDQRSIPINVYLNNGDTTKYWYKVTQKNPTMISISGPSSVVQQVSSALVNMDMSSLTDFTVRAEQYVLLDANGKEMTFPLTRSTSTVTVGVDIYPVKQLTVSADPAICTVGSVAEGYQIAKVEIDPAMITVAGEQDLLDALETISIEPIDVSGANQSFSTVATVSTVQGLQYLSSNQVTAKVYIEEVQTTARFENIMLIVRGLTLEHTAWIPGSAEIKVTGPKSAIDALNAEDLYAYVDVSGLTTGEYDLPIHVEVVDHPEFAFEVFPETMRVTLQPVEETAEESIEESAEESADEIPEEATE